MSDKLRELMKEKEWVGNGLGEKYCQYCLNVRKYGHAKNCRLRQALAEPEFAKCDCDNGLVVERGSLDIEECPDCTPTPQATQGAIEQLNGIENYIHHGNLSGDVSNEYYSKLQPALENMRKLLNSPALDALEGGRG